MSPQTSTLTLNSQIDTPNDVMVLDTEIEDCLEDEKDVISLRYSISVSGRDFPVDVIVKRLREGDIYIPAFQREYVWTRNQASRFIESLLLGLPVPGIFLARERETNKLLVIDGQQRLRSLLFFYEGSFPGAKRPFALRGVHPQFEGLMYDDLEQLHRRQLDNSSLHATLVEDNNEIEYENSIFHIFSRLNTGGTLLKPQEIRGCLYYGELNTLLHKLNEDKSWRAIFGKRHKNLRDQELILRFLALYFNGDNYKSPLKEFLNCYMSENRHLERQSEKEIKRAFVDTVGLLHQSIGKDVFKPKNVLNAAVFDAVMIGVARRLEKGAIKKLDELEIQYQTLLEDPNFMTLCMKIGRTSGDKNVRERLRLAIDAFSDLD